MLPINESFEPSRGGSLQGGHTVRVRTFAGMSGQMSVVRHQAHWFADPERRVSIADK